MNWVEKYVRANYKPAAEADRVMDDIDRRYVPLLFFNDTISSDNEIVLLVHLRFLAFVGFQKAEISHNGPGTIPGH